jgi:MinD-like ATPase involved in chromosome partitioning or flagellar assembly
MGETKKIVVISSKGGVGKSTVSMQVVVPFLYRLNDNKVVKYYECDDENKETQSYNHSELTERKSIKMSDKLVMSDSLIEAIHSDDSCCIDVGGNKSTTMVVNSLSENGLLFFIDLVVIPLLDGEQDAINAIAIYKELKKLNPKIKFLFALNRARNMEQIHYQFDNFFGDVRGVFENKYEIQKILDDDEKENYISVVDDNIIKYSRKFGITIYEISQDKRDFIAQMQGNKDLTMREKKLLSLKYYLQTSSVSYVADVLNKNFEKIKQILQ